MPEIADEEFAEIHVGPEPDDPVEETAEPAASPFDQLKAIDAKTRGAYYKFMDVPNTGGKLVARYTIIGEDEFKVGKRANAKRLPEDQEIGAMIELLVAACHSMWVRADDGELIPLDPDSPVRYDDRLVEGLGRAPQGDAAKNVRKVFEVQVDDQWRFDAGALTAHAEALGRWLADASKESDEEFQGK